MILGGKQLHLADPAYCSWNANIIGRRLQLKNIKKYGGIREVL
jgi:hypothetical protein